MAQVSAPRELWLPAAETLALLRLEAARRGDKRLIITSATLRSWSHRRHIRFDRARGGYDVAGVVAYVTQRGRRGHRPVDQHERDVQPSVPAPPVCPEQTG
ncbi:hypothetical protein [Actinosynnema mirum]|uniref:hypothetical protein n=1 Tax=Actinosynnema mirum TaxID=40567 RepID=UPI00019AB570|nr:hypothetical protein [Actinosynnema mirum]